MRAVSTVVDASLCLLLVSASALTLASAPLADDRRRAGEPNTADETADLLATSTARVTYDDGGEASNRTVHDTLAGLLASAARADASASPDSPPTPFERAVSERVGRALRRPGVGVQVVARWTPSRSNSTSRSGSSRRGRVVAGETPPPDVDLHAAAFGIRGASVTVRTWSR